MNIVEFLKARLAEDEAVARAAVYTEPEWRVETAGDEVRVTSGGEFTEDADGDYFFGAMQVAAMGDFAITQAQFTHIARHDPARVLREVAAKRRILADHVDNEGQCLRCWDGSSPEIIDGELAAYTEMWPCPTIRAIATVYVDHPDFNPEWSS